MRYTGIQPQYFPRLHYFARILNTDSFIIRDEVQFVAKHKYPDGKIGYSYQADTPIKQSTGLYLLHVPTVHNGLQPINETKIAYQEKWDKKHLATLKFVYGKASHFAEIYAHIEELLKKEYDSIADLNLTSLLFGLLYLLGETNFSGEKLTISYVEKKLDEQKHFRLKKIILGSTMQAFKDKSLDRNQKIIAACKEIGATEDYCGDTAFQAYMDKDLFEKNGIHIVVQNWKCPEYQQLFTKQLGFLPNLSIIDLLMNVDKDDAITILQSH